MKKVSQKERIILWFEKHETLTRLEAFTELGIFEAPARICELKKDGYEITTTIENGISSYGYPFKSAIWRLV